MGQGPKQEDQGGGPRRRPGQGVVGPARRATEEEARPVKFWEYAAFPGVELTGSVDG